MELLKTIFDFSAIKALLAREDFSVLYDSMHGVQGPYAKVPSMWRFFVCGLFSCFLVCFGLFPVQNLWAEFEEFDQSVK